MRKGQRRKDEAEREREIRDKGVGGGRARDA